MRALVIALLLLSGALAAPAGEEAVAEATVVEETDKDVCAVAPEAHIAELQRRIACQELLIQRMEQQLTEGDSYLPYTNIKLSPTLMEWQDLFRRQVANRCP